MRRLRAACRFLTVNAAIAVGWPQVPAVVSLEDAQRAALRNHPRIASAEAGARAGRAVVQEVHAAYFPTLAGNITGVGSSTAPWFRPEP